MSDAPPDPTPEEDGAGPAARRLRTTKTTEVQPAEFGWQTFAASADEERRAFVMTTVTFDASTEPKFIVDTWKQAEHWLKTGQALVGLGEGASKPKK